MQKAEYEKQTVIDAINGDISIPAAMQAVFPFGHIPNEMKCERCREFDLDGCPSCPGFGGYD